MDTEKDNNKKLSELDEEIQEKAQEESELDKQINEIKEWNDNFNNPGYYINSGKISPEGKFLSKFPILLIIVGLIIGIIPAINILNDLTFQTIINNFIGIGVSLLFIIGGFIRLLK